MQYMLDGWEAAVRLLAEQGRIDPGRVGASGLSFTGEAVHYAITHSNFMTAATSGHLGMTDPFDFFLVNGMSQAAEKLLRIYGLVDPRAPKNKAYYESGSPAMNASRIRAPLLVQTDEGEFQFGLENFGAMRAAKAPVEVIVFPEEAHLFWQPRHRLIMESRNVEWFRFWLQDYEDRDPAKADQYARWRKLRAERDAARVTPDGPSLR